MTTPPSDATTAGEPQPPPLPRALVAQWPVIITIAAGWLVALVAAFAVPALHGWRPTTIAGLAVGVLGTSIFLWQRASARRGARGAQVGLD